MLLLATGQDSLEVVVHKTKYSVSMYTVTALKLPDPLEIQIKSFKHYNTM